MSTRILKKQAVVPAPPAVVWQAWTTSAGAKTFFAPEARIDARPGGAYELYFDDDQPSGLRGSEGCTIIELEPERRLVFSWNFPPSLPSIRDAHTRVEVTLEPADLGTRVSLTQSGWKKGPDWDQGFAYFDRAWGVVLERLGELFR